jgi:hypothetical protein
MNLTTHDYLRLLASISVAAIAASGCTHTEVKDIVPQDGPTMEQIYDAHMGRVRAAEADGARRELGGRPAADPRPVPVIDSAPEIDEDAGEPGLMTVSLPPGGAAHGNTEHDTVTPAQAGPTDQAAGRPDARTALNGAPAPLMAVGLRAPEVNLAGYTRTAEREIDAIFPRLPNPDLVMYVFPLYERVEYALPGEVPGP